MKLENFVVLSGIFWHVVLCSLLTLVPRKWKQQVPSEHRTHLQTTHHIARDCKLSDDLMVFILEFKQRSTVGVSSWFLTWGNSICIVLYSVEELLWEAG